MNVPKIVPNNSFDFEYTAELSPGVNQLIQF